MAAESEQADESGNLPGGDSSSASADIDDAATAANAAEAANTAEADGATDAPAATAAPATTAATDVDNARVTEDDDKAAAETTGAVDDAEAADDDKVRPEDVREGVVDLVAYAVGAVGLILLGYFTQRDVLTWTRGPFTVVVIIMAVHWVGRRVQARRGRSSVEAHAEDRVPAGVQTRHDEAEGAR